MGVFDSVMAPCPECGTMNEFQSKGGDCILDRYQLHEAPDNVLADVNRHPVSCLNCATPYHIKVRTFAEVVRGHA